MATVPSAPRTGMAVAAYAGSQNVSGSALHPALVDAVDGSGNVQSLIVFDPRTGAPSVVLRPLTLSAWQSAGSNPATPYWNFVDLS